MGCHVLACICEIAATETSWLPKVALKFGRDAGPRRETEMHVEGVATLSENRIGSDSHTVANPF